MSRELSGALCPEQVIEISERCVEGFRVKARLLPLDDRDQFVNCRRYGLANRKWIWPSRNGVLIVIRRQIFARDTLPTASLLYLLLKARSETRGC